MQSNTSRLELLISRQEIKDAVVRLAKQIENDYKDKNPLLVSVLKGSTVFLADLIREIKIPVEIEFVRLSSYGKNTVSSGNVKIIQGIRCSISGRHVVIVEDIVDTGYSIAKLIKYIKGKNPQSVRVCALLDKPSRRKTPVLIDYLGFTVPDRFVVGYGIDFDEKYRYLPEIYAIN